MLTGPHADPDLTELLVPMFAALRRHTAKDATTTDRALLAGHATRRLNGGRNNPMYTCSLAGHRVCVKLHRTDGRQRARREWEALALLADRGVQVAPQPLGYEPNEQPAMAIEYLLGHGLGQTHLTPAQVAALAEANRHLHTITPNDTDTSLLPVRLTADGMLHDLRGFWSRQQQPGHAQATPLRTELAARWAAWSAGPDPLVLAEPVPQVFGQGDPNLTNCLWDTNRNGARLRLIDFEYGGWSDHAYELALLIEHVQSRFTPDAVWQTLLEHSELDVAGRSRVLPARRMAAWYWIKLFWPTTRTDDDPFTTQAQRVIHVLTETEPRPLTGQLVAARVGVRAARCASWPSTDCRA